MSTDRFLITGALGCIGAWTVRNLVREGIPAVVFDLGHDLHRLKLIMTPDEVAQVTFVHGDITNLRALEQALDEHAITHIIHLAALPEARGLITIDEPGFPSPEEFDAGPLVELLESLPQTPLKTGIAATIALFRAKVASGDMAADALLH